MSGSEHASPDPTGWPFSMVQRVRFGDLDAARHLNNVQVLRYFETARIDYLRTVIPKHSPGRQAGTGFIFAECHVHYRSPAFFDDEIRTYVRPVELRRSSLRLEFQMHVEGDGAPAVGAEKRGERAPVE